MQVRTFPSPVLGVIDDELRLPAEERIAFIRSACAGNSDLAAQAERLVALETDAEEFLSEPAVVLQSLAKREEEQARPGLMVVRRSELQ